MGPWNTFIHWIDRRLGYDLFISYRHRGYPQYAEALKENLEKGKPPMRVFLDKDGFRKGRHLDEETLRAVGLSRVQAVLVDASLMEPDSVYVPQEVALFAQGKKPIVPIDIDGSLTCYRKLDPKPAGITASTQKMMDILAANIGVVDRQQTIDQQVTDTLRNEVGAFTTERRRRFYTACLAAAFLVLFGFLIQSLMDSQKQKRNLGQLARQKRAQRLASKAKSMRARNPRLSLLYAVEAVQSTRLHGEAPDAEVLAALNITSAYHPLVWEVDHNLPNSSSACDFAWNATGQGVFTAGDDCRLLEWQLADWPPAPKLIAGLPRKPGTFTFSNPNTPELRILRILPKFLILEYDPGKGPGCIISLPQQAPSNFFTLYPKGNNYYQVQVEISRSGRYIYIHQERASPPVLIDFLNPEKPVIHQYEDSPGRFVGFDPGESAMVFHEEKKLSRCTLSGELIEVLPAVEAAEMGGSFLFTLNESNRVTRYELAEGFSETSSVTLNMHGPVVLVPGPKGDGTRHAQWHKCGLLVARFLARRTEGRLIPSTG